MQNAIDESRFIFKLEKLPKDLQLNNVECAIDTSIIRLDEALNENGYFAENINRIVELSSRIICIDKIQNANGERFYEVIFK